MEDGTTGDEVYVGESEEVVVDDGGTVDLRGTGLEGPDAGVWGVGRVGVRKSTVEDEEGDRGGEVE